MSKNFELLQQVRKEEELYDTSGSWVDPQVQVNGAPSPPLSEKKRQDVLRNSTLPDVLEVS